MPRNLLFVVNRWINSGKRACGLLDITGNYPERLWPMVVALSVGQPLQGLAQLARQVVRQEEADRLPDLANDSGSQGTIWNDVRLFAKKDVPWTPTRTC
jgi:hypothetical protein